MTISFDLPKEIADRFAEDGFDPSTAAKEAALVELYRRAKITHYELGLALGFDRFQTDALLKRHNVTEDSATLEDLEADRQTLDRLLGPGQEC